MSDQNAKRKLTAILYADVVGYSRLTENDELGTHKRVMDALDFATETIESGEGNVLRYAGDAILAEFSSAIAAVNTATTIQIELDKRNDGTPQDSKVEIRIGVNLGEVIEDRGEIYGEGVNLAARLEAAASPGGVCISASVFGLVKGKIGANYIDGGTENFKNISDPVRVYRWQPSKAQKKAPQQLSKRDKPSVAVLPFINMSGDPNQEYLADGISEDIITALSKIRSFLVIARTSTFTYKQKTVDISQVAKELSVRYVLEGSVRTADKRVRVTAQLIDANTGHHIWAEHYDRELDDIFELQDEMTQAIAGAIEPELNAAERERAISKSPDSLNAWEIYQRALWHMYRTEKNDLASAIALFQQSIEVDPNFAPSHAYLSYSYYITIILGWETDVESKLAHGMEEAKKALAIDPKESVAYFARGRIHQQLGESDSAISSLEKAIQLNPNSFYAYHGLAMALALAGRLEESLEFSDKGERISPRDPLLWAAVVVRSLAYMLLQKYEQALRCANEALQFPNDADYWPYALSAAALAQLGRIDSAQQATKDALEKKPDLTLSYLKKTLRTKHKDGLDPYLDGLRKAGLPE